MNRKIGYVLAGLVLLLSGSLAIGQDKPRDWTGSDGRVIKDGVLEGVTSKGASIRIRGRAYDIPLERLSEADQKYIRNWQENAPIQVGPWPDSVKASDVEPEDVSNGEEYIYRTAHFEFHSPVRLSKSVVREFARLFEVTYSGVAALPVGFDPETPKEGYFQTKLYTSMAAYQSDGGIPGSGGMFSWRSRGGEFISGGIKVPLTSLGVERVGERYIVDHKKNSGTLVHEITHQVAVMWGIRGVPTWFSEGLAEYIESARNNSGTMILKNMPKQVEDSVMEHADRYSDGRSFPMVRLEQLMNVSSAEWQAALSSYASAWRNYKSANVLITYFLHFDGDGKGTPVAEYLRALKKGMDAREAEKQFLLRDRSYDQLEAELKEKYKSMRIRF